MIRTLLATVWSLFRNGRDVAFENLALRHQLAVLERSARRPRLTRADRALWITLSRVRTDRWQKVLRIVQPATVIAWHRQGFRAFWTWKSRSRRIARPALDVETRDLIRALAQSNVLWGAPRIHGELRKLGIELSQAVVSKYMPPARTDVRVAGILGAGRQAMSRERANVRNPRTTTPAILCAACLLAGIALAACAASTPVDVRYHGVRVERERLGACLGSSEGAAGGDESVEQRDRRAAACVAIAAQVRATDAIENGRLLGRACTLGRGEACVARLRAAAQRAPAVVDAEVLAARDLGAGLCAGADGRTAFESGAGCFHAASLSANAGADVAEARRLWGRGCETYLDVASCHMAWIRFGVAMDFEELAARLQAQQVEYDRFRRGFEGAQASEEGRRREAEAARSRSPQALANPVLRTAILVAAGVASGLAGGPIAAPDCPNRIEARGQSRRSRWWCLDAARPDGDDGSVRAPTATAASACVAECAIARQACVTAGTGTACDRATHCYCQCELRSGGCGMPAGALRRCVAATSRGAESAEVGATASGG